MSFYACAPLEPAHGRHNYRPCTHVGVFVVAVGSQENFGHFVHPAEEERQLPLVGGGQKKIKKQLKKNNNSKLLDESRLLQEKGGEKKRIVWR